MTPPVVICWGVVRSGSTWLFNVCRLLGEELAKQQGRTCEAVYLLAEELDAYLNSQLPGGDGPVGVVKAHDIGPVALEWINAGRAKVICTYRDPRDCVASHLKFLDWDFTAAARRVAENLQNFQQLGQLPQAPAHVLLIGYEEMMADTFGQIEKIVAHLGIEIDQATLRQIDAQTNIESSRKISQELKARPLDEVLRFETHLIDPTTHLHHNHIGNAKVGRWKDELTPDQRRTLNEVFRSWLLALGYETAESLRDP